MHVFKDYSLITFINVARSVPKFMKRMKVPDYKDKNVFGVPLIVNVQRSGQPLPLGLQQALRYLRSQCLDQVSNLSMLRCMFFIEETISSCTVQQMDSKLDWGSFWIHMLAISLWLCCGEKEVKVAFIAASISSPL